MVAIIKTFISLMLSFLSVFNLAGFFGNTGENAYDVKNGKEILLDFAAISDIQMTDDFIRGMFLECGLDDMDKAAVKGLPIFLVSHWPLALTHGLPETWGEDEIDPMDGSFGDQNSEVEAILKDYENVFLISGHIHNGLVNEERSELYGYTSVESYDSLHSINLPAYSFPTGRGNFMNGNGYSIEVYENEVVVLARNFISGIWLTDYDVTIPLV